MPVAFAEIAYPVFDPVLINIGPLPWLGTLPIRWYALAYIAGLVLGWLTARALLRREKLWSAAARPTVESIDDLLVYMALGVVLGGRIGYVLFYNFDLYLAHPAEILAVWKGGMAFHGGFVGAAVAIWYFARRQKVPVLVVADLCAAVTPLGLALGRVANFIKPELWGRPTDVPWAMVFPDAGPVARHPSQLYEAGLEGVALFILLQIAIRMGALKQPGLVTGLFAALYGVARITSEFFREPDPQLGFLFGGATMGMLLSVPLIIMGLAMIAHATRKKLAQ